MPTRQEHINSYYKYYSLARIPDKKKILKDQELYQLYKIPKADRKQETVILKAHLNLLLPPKLFTSACDCTCLYLPEAIWHGLSTFGIAWSL